jgi:UDP-N-acetyl-alpha-D-muramoyl-L-alanyl-L-glutamate epimerase
MLLTDNPITADRTISRSWSERSQPALTTVKVSSLKVYPHHVDITYQVAMCDFSTKVFYYDVDLTQLEAKYSPDYLHQVYCHIALVEGLKYCSIFPDFYDVSAIADGLSEASLEFFSQVYQFAYTQNLYENQISEYQGPELRSDRPLGITQPITLNPNCPTVLVGNGGGKDSFLSMKALEEANIPYAAFQWGRSEYGRFERQHALSAKLFDHLRPTKLHRISIYDDFTDGVYMQIYTPQLRSPFTLGTPECIFAALPILLQEDYLYLSFGNEKSADTGNLYWSELEREINHQWIKSYDAEVMFDQFIHRHFINNHHYFSLLKPLYDYRIFKNLMRYPEALPDLHSCNIEKPWCKKCPKCAYVWLNYLANFETQVIDRLFQTNPFDDPDLQPYYRQLLGLGEHNAFECVGHVNESRIAMQKCVEKNLQGQAIELFKQEVQAEFLQDWRSLEQKYDRLYDEHNIPPEIFERVKPYL